MKNAQKQHTNRNDESGFITNLRQSSRQLATTVHDLSFADDIALLANNLKRAQVQLITTAKWAKEAGLQVNTSKTQVLTNQDTSTKSIQLYGQTIQ